MKKIREPVSKIVKGFNYAGLSVCFIMVFVVAFDVILRKVSGMILSSDMMSGSSMYGGVLSIKGSNEFTDYFLVAVCALGIPALQIRDGHVWVNMFVNKFPYRFRCFWHGVIMVVETVVAGMLFSGSIIKVQTFGSVARTDVLNMPKWIFAAFMVIGFGEFLILMIIDTIQLFIDGAKGAELKADDGWSDDQVKGI